MSLPIYLFSETDPTYQPIIDRELINLAMGMRPSNTNPENKFSRLVLVIDTLIFGMAIQNFPARRMSKSGG